VSGRLECQNPVGRHFPGSFRCFERNLPLQTLSIVIPALNERENIGPVMKEIPFGELSQMGWDVEVVIVDNGSTDGTGHAAKAHGAKVIVQPVRGYGNAYKAGIANSTGAVIATGDADRTYPFDALPDLLSHMHDNEIDFLSTDRLGDENREAMKPSHRIGNWGLTLINRALFRSPYRDSQSGMWLFRRHCWNRLDVRSGGMGFSQEIKNEAYLKGFNCDEVSIEYRSRGGDVKLNATKDGVKNTLQLLAHRLRSRRQTVPHIVDITEYEHDEDTRMVVG
jgi:glycosyltransferase involved in cell wall biosynthesis